MKAFGTALAYLNKSLADGFWKAGDRLPSFKELGEAAGVSVFTMSKAIHAMSAKGILSVNGRNGVWVTPLDLKSELKKKKLDIDNLIEKAGLSGPIMYPRQSNHAQKWEQIKASITHDIFSRRFDATGSLPSISEMKHAYGVSYPVLKKALTYLEKQGLLVPYKKTYKPRLFSALNYKSKLLVLYRCDPYYLKGYDSDQNLSLLLSNRAKILIAETEKNCNIMNLGYDFLGYYINDDGIHLVDHLYHLPTTLYNLKNYFGVCIFKECPYSDEFHRLLLNLMSTGLPLAMLEGNAKSDVPLSRIKNKSFRIFPVAQSQTAAQRIGRYLIELGHREVAFISHYPEESWSITRYIGLCKAFEMIGTPNRVHLVVDKSSSADQPTADNERIEQLFSKMSLMVDSLKKNGWLSTSLIDHFNTVLSPVIDSEKRFMQLSLKLFPLFEKIIQNPSITAWVVVDANPALMGLQWLGMKKIEVPGQISVIGFDDPPESVLYGLSTYNYDLPGIVQAALTFICNPSLYPATESPVIESCGHIIQRKSTGPARV